jgi:hypothetical protein
LDITVVLVVLVVLLLLVLLLGCALASRSTAALQSENSDMI